MATKSTPGSFDYSTAKPSEAAPTLPNAASGGPNTGRNLSEVSYEANRKTMKKHSAKLANHYARASKVDK